MWKFYVLCKGIREQVMETTVLCRECRREVTIRIDEATGMAVVSVHRAEDADNDDFICAGFGPVEIQTEFSTLFPTF